MTLPAYKDIGTASETTPTWPTHAADDFAILPVKHSLNSGGITTPSGWTKVGTYAHGINSDYLSLFYRRATSSSETNPSLAGGGNYYWGYIVTFTGVHASTPIHAPASSWSNSSADQSCPGITTRLDDCLIVSCFGWDADNAGPLYSANLANADLASVTIRGDSGTITGNGGGLLTITGQLASKATIRATSFTLSAAAFGENVTFALQAADKTLPTLAPKSRIVNTGM